MSSELLIGNPMSIDFIFNFHGIGTIHWKSIDFRKHKGVFFSIMFLKQRL